MAELDVARIRNVLERELGSGCDDRLVMGGLDRMFIQMRDDGLLAGHSAFKSQVDRLPPRGYRSLDLNARAEWLEETLRCLGPAPGRDTRRQAPGAPIGPDSPVWNLPGLGKAGAERMEKLGVTTAADAVFLFPRRYNDFTEVREIARLQPSMQLQTVVGEVLSASQMRRGRRVLGTQAVIGDPTGVLRVTWFNMPYVAKALAEGTNVVVSGRVSAYRGRLQMQNPEYEIVDEGTVSAGKLVPVYPSTQGLSQRTLRRAVGAAVELLAERVVDPVPTWLAREEDLSPLADAIRTRHQPESAAAAERARQRLAIGELLAVQAAVRMRRAEWQLQADAPRIQLGDARAGFVAGLPFALTPAQGRCLAEIEHDILGPHPMLRLLQGDVGSGKTVLAFAAMAAAVRSGCQAVLMAPTEVLAEQHYRSLVHLFGGSGVAALEGLLTPPGFDRPLRALLLTGSLTTAQKAAVRGDAAHGGADIIVGTHALLEDGVAIPRLGLAIVDEQHRFGVAQREKLRQKGLNPHLLVMTATPIPRTLALTVYGDLDVSTIDELPPGRKPIRTRWYSPDEREDAYRFLRKRLDAGEQAFIICPLVEESEALDVRSTEEEYARLLNGPLRGYRLELLHGRMQGRQKDEVMARFLAHGADVLVSTSVIEVGIDVPNATVIVIEGAERFGLSQLHQFRGRVGRSEFQSYCLLFASSDDPGPEAAERLQAMAGTNDGFKLAEIDLEMRGEGETWGRLQSGTNTMLRVARLTDRDLLLRAREMADRVLRRDPQLQLPEHRALAAAARPFLERAAEAN